ncbi:hypothetical protein DICVIV_04470 [Dictyocaulus viviparus]|uniref:PDZ domain-containing protein n=1 Tax=Dictyocaulus viviparus TaxID=29172 RepID=A0A0D8XZT2_DICVI|nr:hypothetical protein DICVIV_04470 [Dictyocaulus viviparus]
MSFETITVRMNRSDSSIKWGFTLRQEGSKIVVGTVDVESLSDKAGMKPGDEVDAICGRDTKNMSINEANNIVIRSLQDIHFNLRRYITAHTCLPWTLTEKDNKLFVDEIQPGYGSGFGTEHKDGHRSSPFNHHSINSRQEQNALAYNQSSYKNNSSSSIRNNYQGSYIVDKNQGRAYQSPSTYLRHEQFGKNQIASYGASVQGGLRTQHPTTDSSLNTGGHSITVNRNVLDYIALVFLMEVNVWNARSNNDVSTTAYEPKPKEVPLNQKMFVHTSPLSSVHRFSTLSPGGTRVYYHTPSERTRRELSPHASVQHLQYNSPLKLYSAESAAEQYSQQSGCLNGLPVSVTPQLPSYMSSEVKKLIDEEEHGNGHRLGSQSAQSSSFKRISEAVGAPVK